MNANVDLEQVQKSIKQIEVSLQKISATEKEISSKYKELGNTWHDNKYQYLGSIVNECNSSLSKMRNQLESTLTSLRKIIVSISDYENVDLMGGNQSDNSFIASLRAMVNPNAGNVNTSLLGVSTNGSSSQEYVATLHNRYENADPLARRVFDSYRDELCIRNANYPPNQTAHYSPMGYPGHPRGVYYNSSSDENNPRGNGTTYFHELGHMIDHASTGYNGNTSHTDEFRNALIADGQNVLRLYNQLPADRQQGFLRRIYQGNAHSFSDLIDATTNGQLHGAYGHSRDYWTHDGNLQAEAFAHFFEASMGCEEKREFLSNFFPTAFGIFSGMLENIVADQRELVLTR